MACQLLAERVREAGAREPPDLERNGLLGTQQGISTPSHGAQILNRFGRFTTRRTSESDFTTALFYQKIEGRKWI